MCSVPGIYRTYCRLTLTVETLTVEMGMGENGNSTGKLGEMGIMCKIQNGGMRWEYQVIPAHL